MRRWLTPFNFQPDQNPPYPHPPVLGMVPYRRFKLCFALATQLAQRQSTQDSSNCEILTKIRSSSQLNSYLNDEHKPITLGIEAISKLILAICLVLFVSHTLTSNSYLSYCLLSVGLVNSIWLMLIGIYISIQ